MKHFLLFMPIIFSCGVAAEDYILVALDKSVYTTEDDFIAHLTGLSENSVQYIGLSIETQQNNSWVTVRADTSCLCMAKCKKRATEIVKGQTIEENWDFKDNACNEATLGTYRAIITGNYITALGINRIIGTSNEFKIK